MKSIWFVFIIDNVKSRSAETNVSKNSIFKSGDSGNEAPRIENDTQYGELVPKPYTNI